MARRRGWVVAVVVALTGAGFVGVAPSAGAAEGAATAFTSAGGGNRNAWVEDASNATMDTQASAGSLYVTSTHADGSNGGGAHFFTEMEATPLPTSGTHPLSSGGPLSLWLSDGEWGWCVVEGEVTVREMTLDADGVPTAAALDWTGDCQGAPSGQVRFNSTVPYGGVDVRTSIWWDTVLRGETNRTEQLVVTGHGTERSTVDAVEFGPGDTLQDFVVRHGTDSCTGTPLTGGTSCSLTLMPAPQSAEWGRGARPLYLRMADGTTSTTTLSYSTVYDSPRGRFAPMTGRVMDTRKGTGVRKGAVGAGQSVTLKVAGRTNVPATGAGAAVLNLTVTGSTRPGYVTAYPAGSTRPTASSINFPAGWTGANLVTVPLGAGGAVTFYNAGGSVNLVADLVGVYAKDRTSPISGSDFYPHEPTRIFDSRTAWKERLGPNEYFGLRPDYGAAWNDSVTAVVVNVTSTGTTGTGYLSATTFEPQYGPPGTSTLNYTKGLTSANMAVVPVESHPGTRPSLWVANTGSASTHVVVDVVGFYAGGVGPAPEDGFRFRPLTPTRVVDTRTDLGLASIGTNTVGRVQAPATVAGRDTWSLVGNLTGVAPSVNTYLTAWDAGPRPAASNLNLMKGATRANSAWPGLDTGNGFRLHNAAGSLEAVMDVTGSFELFPPSPDTLAGVPEPSTPTSLRAAGKAAAPDVAGPKAATGPAPTARTWVR
ncbi:hypothetical protein [Phycicoccus sonneratiae]|uniref:Uncharacterized protein n=1 Tax=Phycicoccus sonneratiae TaxID=2807628 RepID=A0ABS2CGR7_9MICO|nr:hypothetical protein [Phycicoccus sonneraticus]MBM6399066.1 hypothetical protein [Phycicoccus sonneraticus]